MKNGWQVVNALPNTNWYKRGGQELSGDLGPYGDVGMYDMFLHKQDRAYTVPQLYEFVEKAGLNFVDYNSPHSRIMLKPETYFQDPEFLKKIKAMDKWKQQAICEIMCGSIVKHSFYVSKRKNLIARITDMDNVPYIYTINNLSAQIADHIKNNQRILGSIISFSFISDFFADLSINLPVSQYTEHLFRNMISGDKSLAELHKAIEKDLGKKVSDSEFLGELNRIFPIMEEVGVLLLRNKKISIAPFY